MKTIKFHAILLVSFVLLFSSVCMAESSLRKAGAAGVRTGRLWASWYRLQLEAISGGGSEALSERLSGLLMEFEKNLKELGADEELIRKSQRLLGALEREAPSGSGTGSESKHWSFGDDDSFESSGAQVKTLTPERWDVSFSYLHFPDAAACANLKLPEADTSSSTSEGSFILEWWINPVDVEEVHIVDTEHWSLKVSQGVLELDPRSSSNSIRSGVTIASRNWYHLAIVSSPSTTKLLLNGELIGEGGFNLRLQQGQTLKLGSGYVGEMDEVWFHYASTDISKLHFYKPLEYYLIFPLMSWIQNQDRSINWAFQAGLLMRGINEKSQVAELTKSEVMQVVKVLSGETSDVPPPPENLPPQLEEIMDELGEMIEDDLSASKTREKIRRLSSQFIAFFSD